MCLEWTISPFNYFEISSCFYAFPGKPKRGKSLLNFPFERSKAISLFLSFSLDTYTRSLYFTTFVHTIVCTDQWSTKSKKTLMWNDHAYTLLSNILGPPNLLYNIKVGVEGRNIALTTLLISSMDNTLPKNIDKHCQTKRQCQKWRDRTRLGERFGEERRQHEGGFSKDNTRAGNGPEQEQAGPSERNSD